MFTGHWASGPVLTERLNLYTYQLNHFWNRPTTFDRLDHNQIAGYHDLPYDTCCWTESKCTKKPHILVCCGGESMTLRGPAENDACAWCTTPPRHNRIPATFTGEQYVWYSWYQTSSKYYREAWSTDKRNSRGPIQIDSSQAPARNGYLGLPLPLLQFHTQRWNM